MAMAPLEEPLMRSSAKQTLNDLKMQKVPNFSKAKRPVVEITYIGYFGIRFFIT